MFLSATVQQQLVPPFTTACTRLSDMYPFYFIVMTPTLYQDPCLLYHEIRVEEWKWNEFYNTKGKETCICNTSWHIFIVMGDNMCYWIISSTTCRVFYSLNWVSSHDNYVDSSCHPSFLLRMKEMDLSCWCRWRWWKQTMMQLLVMVLVNVSFIHYRHKRKMIRYALILDSTAFLWEIPILYLWAGIAFIDPSFDTCS